jgi:cytochrome c oxidase subunit 2
VHQRFACLAAFAGLLLAPAALHAAPGIDWIPLPEGASTVAPKIDAIFWLILWITGIVFVVVELALLFFIFKWRHKDGRKVVYTHGNNTLEIIWTVVPAAILVFIGVKSQGLWETMKELPAGEPTIEVVGQQFNWKLRYAGPDGHLGRTAARFVIDPKYLSPKGVALNSFGLDPDDAAGADDLYMDGTLLLRKGEKTRIRIRSKDVIHSFFIPVFRFKQDAVPGMPVDIWVEPTKANIHFDGTEMKTDTIWQIACAELCGNLHTTMKGNVWVADSQSDYDQAMATAVRPWEMTPPVVAEDFFHQPAPAASAPPVMPDAASAPQPASSPRSTP